MAVSQKIGNLLQDPAISLLVIYIKDAQSYYKDIFNYVHSSIICNNQNQETTQMPLIQRMGKENVAIYTLEYFLVVKTNSILNFACKLMELENIILSEVTQTPKK